MRLITDPALDGITGQFFDGLATARALPEAYDPQFRAELGGDNRPDDRPGLVTEEAGLPAPKRRVPPSRKPDNYQ